MPHKAVPGNRRIRGDVTMRAYRFGTKTVHHEARDDTELVVLEVGRTGIARSRAHGNDPSFISSNYARTSRIGRGRSSSSSHAVSVTAGPGSSMAAVTGIRQHRIKLSD